MHGEETVPSGSGFGKTGQLRVNQRKQSPPSDHIKTINAKWFKDLNTRHGTTKLLEKNMGKLFSNINHSNIFLDHLPKQKKYMQK